MFDQKILDELSHKISSLLPADLQLLRSDIESNIRATLESSLRNMNLISREEFDVQTALLARTREQLQKMEDKLAELEQNLK